MISSLFPSYYTTMCYIYMACSGTSGGARRIDMHIVTVAEMRELEARAEREYGLTSPILMENAGKSAAEILAEHINRPRSVPDLEFLILVGPGNNGGDGLVMGRYLEKWGGLVSLYRWKEQRLTIGGEDVPEKDTQEKLEEKFQH